MIGITQSYFRWKEPSHNSEESSGIERIRLFKLLGVIVLSSTVFLILLNHRYPIPISKTLIVLAAIILFIVVIYYHTIVRPYVVVTNNHIYRGLNDDTAEVWKYKNISHCEFSTKIVDGTVYNTMVIETREGEKSLILIAPAISVNALKSFLLAKGIQEPASPTTACSRPRLERS